MTPARAVIGANYGDEGKGLMTDYHVHDLGQTQPAMNDVVVVRFNGGAQAGHTVTTPGPDGARRHVFSHIGSGALLGAATYLSRFFVVNPLLFFKELEVLSRYVPDPKIHIDPACPVTTPFEMMINQVIEKARGGERHGSCGVGFGETIERNLTPDCTLIAQDLARPDRLRAKLERIRDTWLPARLKILGVANLPDERAAIIRNDAIITRFIDDCAAFTGVISLRGIECMEEASAIVFEGAQGLLLDQDRGAFPHVTRSNTGLKNILALAGEANIERIDVTYATRAYVTRHGAGPLKGELGAKPYPAIKDLTNIPNDWQGSLRFAHLDIDDVKEAIESDLNDTAAHPEIEIRPNVSICCLDQTGDTMTYVKSGQERQIATGEFGRHLASHLGFETWYESRGATRFDVTAMGPAQDLVAA